jgi:hypothetical protein
MAVFDGDFLGWASHQGLLWVMNRALQGHVAATSLYPWLPAAPAAAPAVIKISGGLSGAVRYYFTYSTYREHESNPSPVSEEISDTATTFGVTLTIPASDNPEVTKCHIYRVGGLLPVPYLVYTLNATSGVISDDGGSGAPQDNGDPNVWFLSDAAAIEYGQAMEDDHDPPPAAFGLAGPYFERLLAFNSLANPNRLWWTPTSMPWYFRGSGTADGDWVDVGEEGEPIWAVSVKPHMCIIYKQHSIWRLLGDPSNGLIERVIPHMGIVGPRAWASHGVVDYFRGPEGIYLMTGELAIKVSTKVDPMFKGLTSGVARPTSPIDAAERYGEVLAVKVDRLYHCYREQ